ncbi:MAG TPA: hypothetical protein VG605_13825, partial [Puia sp.]|nr:hypothetical protein [Puia sp.]
MDAVYGQPPVKNVLTMTATCSKPNGQIKVVLDGVAPPYQIFLYGGALLSPILVNTSADSVIFNGLYGGTFTYGLLASDAAGNSVNVYPLVGNLAAPSIVAAFPTSPASCLNNDGIIEADLSGGTAPFSLVFDGQTVGSSMSETLTGSGVASGNLAFLVQDANGCVTPGAVTVPLNNNLTLSTADASICQGSSTTLAVTSNATGYAWSPTAGLSSVLVAEPVASPLTTTAYTLSATLGVCSATGTAVVTVLPAPVPDAGGPVDTTCYGKPIRLHGSGGAQYKWTPFTGLSDAGVADPLVERPTSNITYTLSVVGADGCPGLTTSKVTVIVRSPYKVFAGDDTSVAVGQSVPLLAVDIQGVGFSSFLWSPALGLNDAAVADPV